jgi:predicted nucleic acid-binding protein
MDQAIALMQHREFEVPSLQVLDLAAASTCSAYDCEFVALAQNLGVPLVTADRRILGQFPRIAVLLDSFVGV